MVKLLYVILQFHLIVTIASFSDLRILDLT